MAGPVEAPDPVAPAPGTRGRRGVGLARARSLLGTVPFFAYVTIFLAVPTLVVVIGAFTGDGGFTLSNLAALGDAYILAAFGRSILLSAVTAAIGAVLGSLLAYALVTAKPGGMLRRVVTAGSGVLAQFGGVTLAFAFLATVGFEGFVTVWLRDRGIDLFSGGAWIFELPGLVLVYTYFQVPLMVILVTPALEGLLPQWREAAENLGASAWSYWRLVALPVLAPALAGATLVLFGNAFAAYATALALTSGSIPLVPTAIASALSGNVLVGQANVGLALGLDMVVVIGIVMVAYLWLQRRAARWSRR